ncbi:MAG: ribose transport system permease protein [Frankiales bacterium]|nr:ribose transport system permease protein [Frankiales bacterium]
MRAMSDPATGTTVRPEVPVSSARPEVLRRLSRVDPRQIGLPVAVLVMIVVFAIKSDVFLSTSNFQNVGLQAAALACVACGQTFVILTAGLDLSVGSTAALVSVVCAMGFRDQGWWAGIAFGLLAGLVIGLVNGLVVTRLRVAPFIATLAMLSVASGVALNLSGGTPLTGLPVSFTSLAYKRFAGFPLPVLIAIALLIIAYLVLRVSRLGRYIYAAGGNSEAARLSGINVRGTAVAAYMICALLAAVGGLILTARVASGQPTLGSDLALQSVAAVVLGGVSLFGGRGSMIGVAVGVVFVSILSNGLNLLGVSSYTQLMVIGVAMVAAIAWDQYLGRKWRTRGEAA